MLIEFVQILACLDTKVESPHSLSVVVDFGNILFQNFPLFGVLDTQPTSRVGITIEKKVGGSPMGAL